MDDGGWKNLQVIGDELREWAGQMKLGLARFKHASIRLDKTNVLHLLQNLITETFRAFPRTLGYAFSFYCLVKIWQLLEPQILLVAVLHRAANIIECGAVLC